MSFRWWAISPCITFSFIPVLADVILNQRGGHHWHFSGIMPCWHKSWRHGSPGLRQMASRGWEDGSVGEVLDIQVQGLEIEFPKTDINASGHDLPAILALGGGDKGFPRVSQKGRLAKMANSGLSWEILPHQIMWGAVKHDSWCQPCTSPCTHTHVHM